MLLIKKDCRKQKELQSEDFFKGKVNKIALNFVKCQLKQQMRKSKGHRFTIEDKIFGLSLLKQSPKCYQILQKTFALPSRRTLINLKKILFQCGINHYILASLEKSVEGMNELDRYCCLLFDEMSVKAALTYNPKEDSITGFEDIGYEKRPKFADHVMVFMARGICRKLKQPVCDQLAINSAVINNLKNLTHEEFRMRNEEKFMFGFCIGGEEINSLYDLPHLLKGIRNNMLENKVKFTRKQCNQQVASWDDTVALYELDVGDHDTRMLNKLTDEHIYKTHIGKAHFYYPVYYLISDWPKK